MLAHEMEIAKILSSSIGDEKKESVSGQGCFLRRKNRPVNF
jgi:hypothetical protein